MMMNGRKFMTGLGIGMVAGGALCMMMAPKAKRNDEIGRASCRERV